MDHLEIEVKFFLVESNAIRRKILALGGIPAGCGPESNARYDTPCASLLARETLLRLRRDARITLTYKGPPGHADPHFKVMRELEVQVADFDAMHAILEALGFRRVQVYEKRRETFCLGNLLLCLDTMPFGDFLELEGERPRIRQAADALGLVWSERLLANYLQIFEWVKTAWRLDFNDVTFANFRRHPIEADRLRSLLLHQEQAHPITGRRDR